MLRKSTNAYESTSGLAAARLAPDAETRGEAVDRGEQVQQHLGHGILRVSSQDSSDLRRRRRVVREEFVHARLDPREELGVQGLRDRLAAGKIAGARRRANYMRLVRVLAREFVELVHVL